MCVCVCVCVSVCVRINNEDFLNGLEEDGAQNHELHRELGNRPVGDDDAGSSLCDRVESLHHQPLRLGVEG